MIFQNRIQHDDHTESYEFTSKGELYHKGRQDYLRFEEALTKTETVQTTIKWDGHELMLIRQGTVIMRQGFVSGKETLGRYVTPEASWETKADTDKVTVVWPTHNQRGKIHIKYRFTLQGQDAGEHEVRLTLEEDQ